MGGKNNSITYSGILNLLSEHYDAEFSVIKQDVDLFISTQIEEIDLLIKEMIGCKTI